MSNALLSARQHDYEPVIAPVEDARNPFVKLGVNGWQSLRGHRRFPARGDLTLRSMAAFLSYSVIIAVIDKGADYEFRYVGDAQRQAFKTYFKGMRLTQIEAAIPELGQVLRGAYEQARATAVPFLVRGRVASEPADSQFRCHETAFLPLGANDAAVDHLLIVGVQVPDPFWKVSDVVLKALTGRLAAPG